MRQPLVISLITIFSICFTINDSNGSEEPCLIVKIYNERKDLFESAQLEMFQLDKLKRNREEIVNAGQDPTKINDDIEKKTEIIDTKLLLGLDLLNEQETIFKYLFNEVYGAEKIYNISRDHLEQKSLENELDSKYECLAQLREAIKRRKVSKNRLDR